SCLACSPTFLSVSLLPPASPPSPSTALFRSGLLPERAQLHPAGRWRRGPVCDRRRGLREAGAALDTARAAPASRRPLLLSHTGRSEEHTSELQSRENLVCRLLLEKKKRTAKT